MAHFPAVPPTIDISKRLFGQLLGAKPLYFALTLIGAALLLLSATTVQANITGPCKDGYRWSAHQAANGPVATYNECTPSADFISVGCGAGWPEMRVEYPFEGLAPDQTLFTVMKVDGQDYDIMVKTAYSEMLGASYITVLHDHISLGAMFTGKSARISVEGTDISFHLSGSASAIEFLTGRC